MRAVSTDRDATAVAAQAGSSLIELMITVSLLSVAVLGLLGAFGGIQGAIQTGRTKSLATNICREKLEILKNLPYAKLHVTSAADLAGRGFDDTVYTPERLVASNTQFTRYTLVKKAHEDAARNIVDNDPQNPDTSLKKIEVWVEWRESRSSKRHRCASFLSDPARIPLHGRLTGLVSQAPGGAGLELSQATVVVLDNPNWTTRTDAAGLYVLLLSPGLHTLRISKRGYFHSEAVVDVTTDTVHDAVLSPIATGSVWGRAYLREHPLISQVVADTGTAHHEYVELYNPSTWTWNLDGYSLGYVDAFNNESALTLFGAGDSISANGGFFLVANATSVTVGGASIDADRTYGLGTAPEYVLLAAAAGGVVLRDPGGRLIDRVAWSRISPPQDCPTQALEGACLSLTDGLAAGQQLVRWDDGEASPLSALSGRSWDTDSNLEDFNREVPGAAKELSLKYLPANRSALRPPGTGTPARGAIVAADDFLSSPASVVSATGYFLLPGIATATVAGNPGFWTVSVASGPSLGTVSAVSLSAGQTLDLGDVVLSTTATTGFITGTVYSAIGGVLAGIVVQQGGFTTVSGADGSYRLVVPPGTGLTVAANPGNIAGDYSARVIGGIDVVAGQTVSGVDFILDPAGRAVGVLLSQSGDPVTGVEILAEAPPGIRRGSALTGADGRFSLIDLPASSVAGVGDYTVYPTLDPSQSSSPGFAPAVVTVGAEVDVGTFTLTGSLSLLAGSVTEGGRPITTGVLVLASTAPVPGDPPVFDDAIRNSSSLYYTAHTTADGSFALQVRAGPSPYYVYAWYAKWASPGALTSTRKTAVLTVPAPNATYPVDFSWP